MADDSKEEEAEQLAAAEEEKRTKEAFAKLRRSFFNFSLSTNTVDFDSKEEEAKLLAKQEKTRLEFDAKAIKERLESDRRLNYYDSKAYKSMLDKTTAKLAGVSNERNKISEDKPDLDKGPEALDDQQCEVNKKSVDEGLPNLPSDCIWRILLKLPVDSLVRSQLVSKRWFYAINGIIRSPVFAEEHLPRSEMVLLFRHNPSRIESLDREQLISDKDIFYVERRILGHRWENVNKDELKGEKEVHFSFLDMKDGTARYYMLASFGVLQGVCNGLLLLINRSICGPILVNPVSRECIEIIRGTEVPPESESYGFAFNSTTGKYLVVHLFKQFEDIGCEIFEVGSSDHWRKIQGPQRGLITHFPTPSVFAGGDQFKKPPVFAGGAVHWLPCAGACNYLVSMGISDETFHRIELPENQGEKYFGQNDFKDFDGLIEKDGLLSFIHHDINGNFHVWVLNKDLDKSQWTLENILRSPDGPNSLYSLDMVPVGDLYSRDMVPIGYNSSKNELLLMGEMQMLDMSTRLFIWDLEEGKMKCYDNYSPSIGWFVPHFNSLVPLLPKKNSLNAEELKTYDHRLLGAKQELFFCHHHSPGSWFFLPYGTRIFNKLVDFIRVQYRERGYEEVVTPNMYNMQLWETSGHAEDCKENMFMFEIEKQEFGLKQMNCPGHCLMFDHRVRSYRELPLRLADFGVLHRNEASEALTGLTHTRRFQQDDAHIFCRESQIRDEVKNVLEFIRYAYDIFGFTFELELSTRPEKYLGEKETWDKAEVALTRALNEFGRPWKRNEGDGAVYGPKIDINVFDALKRKFRCATLQLDFQLPSRFNLSYSVEDDTKREKPVMIHMAVLGSIEHMIAVLLEQHNGKWPFWLSPRQVIVCSVSKESTEYALELQGQIRAAGYYVDVDITDTKIGNKVQEARLAEYNYMLVVGEADARERTVSRRARDDMGEHAVTSIEELLTFFKEEAAAFH